MVYNHKEERQLTLDEVKALYPYPSLEGKTEKQKVSITRAMENFYEKTMKPYNPDYPIDIPPVRESTALRFSFADKEGRRFAIFPDGSRACIVPRKKRNGDGNQAPYKEQSIDGKEAQVESQPPCKKQNGDGNQAEVKPQHDLIIGRYQL